jgi:hypothetical protein
MRAYNLVERVRWSTAVRSYRFTVAFVVYFTDRVIHLLRSFGAKQLLNVIVTSCRAPITSTSSLYCMLIMMSESHSSGSDLGQI